MVEMALFEIQIKNNIVVADKFKSRSTKRCIERHVILRGIFFAVREAMIVFGETGSKLNIWTSRLEVVPMLLDACTIVDPVGLKLTIKIGSGNGRSISNAHDTLRIRRLCRGE